VVSHEAARTGAPAVALEVTRSLRARGWEAVTVLRLDGPLRLEFALSSDRVEREPL
jgi:hypothetical protein